jgi:hypothetical protein
MSSKFRSAGRRFFSLAVYEGIVTRAEQTGATIAEICASDRTLPSAPTAYTAVYSDAALAARYAEVMRQRKLTEGAA